MELNTSNPLALNASTAAPPPEFPTIVELVILFIPAFPPDAIAPEKVVEELLITRHLSTGVW